MKLLDFKVFPSEEQTISVAESDIYGGAHHYQAMTCEGFSNGVVKYTNNYLSIKFIKKEDDGTINPGVQSEQLVYILLDRTQKLNARFPSPQNEKMMAGLQMFLDACKERVQDRIDRGVMGNLKK